MTDLLGRIIDRKYRITRELGEGGMGTVFEAEHTLINRKVAVKIMHSAIASLPEAASRFLREAQSASAIGHPNIVEIFDVGKEEDGILYLVMELLDGYSLGDLMAEQGALPPDRVVVIILQVLSALAAAHEKGIIHRDLKPDNIYLYRNKRNQEELKLLDFGIAKVQGALEGDQGLTLTGTVLGTPHYMSPEQARGKPIDQRIDIWSTGIMMYEMLVGELPYPGESYNKILSEILLETPPSLRDVAPHVPDGLVAIVEKAMAKDPDERFLYAGEMISVLMSLTDHVDQVSSMMTDSAAQALRSSVAPSPYAATEIHSDPAIERRRSFGDRRQPRPSPMSGLTRPATPRGMFAQPRSRISLLFRGAIALAVLFAVLILSSNRTDDFSKQTDSVYKIAVWHVEDMISFWGEVLDGVGGADGKPSTRVSRRPRPPAVHNSRKGELAAVGSAAVADGDAAMAKEENSDEKEDSTFVTIELEGVVKTARISLDGERVAFPIILPRSGDEKILKIKARGYRPVEQTIVPDEDKTVTVSMKKKKRRRSSRRKRKRAR